MQYPDDPNVSLTAMSAGIAEGQRGIAQYYAEATLAKSAQARAIVAAAASKDEATALTLDEFAASRTEAAASLETTGLALADSVAWAQGSANRALVGFAADIRDVQKSVEGALAAASAGNAFTLWKLQADTDTAKQQTQSLADADTLSMQMLLNGKAHDKNAEAIRLYGEQQRRQIDWEQRRADTLVSVLEAAVDAVQTAVDVAALVSPPGFREAMAGTSIAISYFRGNKIDAVAAGENGVLLAFELVKMISPAGRLASLACMGIRLTYLGFGAYRMYQGYQEGSWSKMALGALSVLLSLKRACFVAGTQVVVGVNADGSYITKNIEDIREGDYVLSRDANDPTAPLVMSRVTGTYEKQVDRLQVVQVRDEATGNVETLQTTAEHPFYVDGLGWTPAGELLAGQRVENPDGGFSVVVGNSCEVYPDRVSVYNFTVDGTHTYFVEDGLGDQTAVWVHNAYRPREGAWKYSYSESSGKVFPTNRNRWWIDTVRGAKGMGPQPWPRKSFDTLAGLRQEQRWWMQRMIQKGYSPAEIEDRMRSALINSGWRLGAKQLPPLFRRMLDGVLGGR